MVRHVVNTLYVQVGAPARRPAPPEAVALGRPESAAGPVSGPAADGRPTRAGRALPGAPAPRRPSCSTPIGPWTSPRAPGPSPASGPWARRLASAGPDASPDGDGGG